MTLLRAASPAPARDPKCPKVRSIPGEITDAWKGKGVVCIAGGPSLTPEQLELVRTARARDAVRVIAVNDAYLLAPWADVLYFADAKWAKLHIDGLKRVWPWVTFQPEHVRAAFASFAGQRVTIEHSDTFDDPSTFYLKNYGPTGISENRTGICTGSNSGYQSLNIAVLSGGDPTLLVAYDMQYAKGKSHSHNGYSIRTPESAYHGFARNFTSMEIQLARRGVKVINCTPGSRITAFPFGDLGECLARIA